MDTTLLEFGRGPLFRFCFAVMVLNLLRIFVLSAYGAFEALNRAGDNKIAWKPLLMQTVSWLVPVTRFWKLRPIYGTASVIWHAAIILTPIFFSAHIFLWGNALGFTWPALSDQAAEVLTIVAVVFGMGMFLSRVLDRRARALSRFQDYAWPPLIALTFLTGWFCANSDLTAGGYMLIMLVHVYSANLIMFLIPFTKVAHCILMPLSQIVSHVGWRFPVGAGAKVTATIRHKEKAA